MRYSICLVKNSRMAYMPEKNIAFCLFSGATSNLVDVQQTSSISKLNVGIIINLVWSSAMVQSG